MGAGAKGPGSAGRALEVREERRIQLGCGFALSYGVLLFLLCFFDYIPDGSLALLLWLVGVILVWAWVL